MTRRPDIHAQLELYAAGALSTNDLLAFDEHLRQCALCGSRAPALLEAAAALVPDAPAPAHTWDRIVSAIQGRGGSERSP